jgi:lactoylglutathione lyase
MTRLTAHNSPLTKKLLCFLVLCLACRIAGAQSPVLNHVAVYVQDLKKSTYFYGQVVGLDTVPEPFHDGRHTWFSIGGRSCLHIISGAESITTHDKNSHLCLSVPSVEAFILRLNRAGVPFEDWPGKPGAFTTRADGVHQIYFKDPDGWWIEINDAK